MNECTSYDIMFIIILRFIIPSFRLSLYCLSFSIYNSLPSTDSVGNERIQYNTIIYFFPHFFFQLFTEQKKKQKYHAT